ncbi:hypothetical protein DFA_00039 [Cavenderia fasciculata]|uniref:Transmembrane protein n=1 Tax=Cavenderia fasciculata TaxID=261658 RepID=F4PXF2_CACFS|nr:uncharacterized protein DFA_00039 [Cavenderia fasciculata]EGG19462.1 hypothetical protein DFA_00039 [Cavenderia fasciculata]|eukprot:XP_004357756.1 hypothetical protein DFA_00039 [Cavenderia fasciculata]
MQYIDTIKEVPLKLAKETLTLASTRLHNNVTLAQGVKVGLLSTAVSFSLYYLKTIQVGPSQVIVDQIQHAIDELHQKVTVEGEIDLSGAKIQEVLQVIYNNQFITKDISTSANVLKLLEIMSVTAAAIRSTYETQNIKHASKEDIKTLFDHLQNENTISISIQIMSQLLLNMKKEDIPIHRIVSFCKSQFTPLVCSEMICLSLAILVINRRDCYQILIDSGIIVVFEFLITKHLKNNIPSIKYAMLQLIAANGPVSKNQQTLPQIIIDKYITQARLRYYLPYALQHQKLPVVSTFIQMAAFGMYTKRPLTESIGFPILLVGGMSIFGTIISSVKSLTGSAAVESLGSAIFMTGGYILVKCTSVKFASAFVGASMVSLMLTRTRESSGHKNIKPYIYPEEIIEHEKKKEIKKRVKKELKDFEQQGETQL